MTSAHHLEVGPEVFAGNDGLGRYILLPGSVNRAARVAARFDNVVHHENRRKLDVFTGTWQGIDLAVVPTGMGCPSVDIVVNEILALGGRRFLRIGTAGSLQAHVPVGDLVLATGGVRDEGTSLAYAVPGFPALADATLLSAAMDAAILLGHGRHVHAGLVHTKDSFFGREFAQGPLGARNKAYMDDLARAGVLASEMESAHLFILASVLQRGPTDVLSLRSRDAGLRAGALLAIIGTVEHGLATREEEQKAEERLIEVALGTYQKLALIEGSAG
jgi:uridine phosphorylase